MKVISNTHKSWCAYCAKLIPLDECPHKVKDKDNSFHLLCYYKWLNNKVEKMEATISDLKKCKKEIKKYNKQLLLETLGDNGQ
jgi:hypothetical protein